ncbi:MAG: peptidoglycan-associated lipoprotein Pal [Acidobacteria bacterium]|nr:peptidoglycan-associated lipoprotein Pal [Acidobacteriota bacterium]
MVAASLGTAIACSKKAPVVQPTAPPPTTTTPIPDTTRPPAPPTPVPEPVVAPPPVVREDPIASASLDDLNRNSPLKPAFFDYNSSELNAEGQKALDEDALVLKRFSTWAITIEGHCDERGTPEYNLALGERRAVAARTYLVSLGIAADRLRIVSYGKEFPFDPGHTEAAFAKNRRAHFVITAK